MRHRLSIICLAALMSISAPHAFADGLRLEWADLYGLGGMPVYSVPKCGVFAMPQGVRIIPQWQMDPYSFVGTGASNYFSDNGDGTWTYHYNPASPAVATYTQFHDSATSWIVTVRNEPCIPSLQPDSASTDHRRPVSLNVLANDRASAPTTALRVTSVSQPSRGSVSWNENGTVTYVPEPGHVGAVAMTYTAVDGLGSTGSTTVTVASRVCYEQVWKEAQTTCAMQGRIASADFAGSCTHEPEGYEQIEVPCP